MTTNCLFCKIAAGQIPAKKLYEDEEVIAFHDINPAAPVHFLIVPKQHIATLADCEDGVTAEVSNEVSNAASKTHQALLGKMLALAPRLARDMGCGYTADPGGSGKGKGGFKTFINTGPGGGQEVYHLHIHVLGGALPWQSR